MEHEPDAPHQLSSEDAARSARRKLPPQSQAFFYVLLAAMLILTWLVLRPFIVYMIAGVFAAVLSLPIQRQWRKVFRPRGAAALTILTLFVLVTLPLVLLGLSLIDDVRGARQAIEAGAVDDLIDRVVDPFYPDQTVEQRRALIESIWSQLQPSLQDFLGGLVADLVAFIGQLFVAITVILFVVYYVLVDGKRLVRYLRRAAPLPAAQLDFLLGEARRGLHAVFVGQILTSMIQGALGGIAFLIVGLPSPIMWAVLMAILSLLPVVGAFVVWVPAALILLFVEGKIWQAIFLTAWGVIVIGQADNFLRPRLIGDRSGIHPLFVLLGVLGGVAAFGFVGLFLGPLLVGVTISVLKVWESDYLSTDVEPAAPPPEPARPENQEPDAAERVDAD